MPDHSEFELPEIINEKINLFTRYTTVTCLGSKTLQNANWIYWKLYLDTLECSKYFVSVQKCRNKHFVICSQQKRKALKVSLYSLKSGKWGV